MKERSAEEVEPSNTVTRGLTKVVRQLSKSRQLLTRWSSKFQWSERVAAFDSHQDSIRQSAAEKAIAKVAAKAAEKRELTAQSVLDEAASIAFSRVNKAVRWDDDTLNLISSDQLPDDVAAAIESIEIRHDKDGNPICPYFPSFTFSRMHPLLLETKSLNRMFQSSAGNKVSVNGQNRKFSGDETSLEPANGTV